MWDLLNRYFFIVLVNGNLYVIYVEFWLVRLNVY